MSMREKERKSKTENRCGGKKWGIEKRGKRGDRERKHERKEIEGEKKRSKRNTEEE